tara:strand:- start:6028 stop:7443 length:1416 start_codon:yes stop_codon:yes gene_type:complete
MGLLDLLKDPSAYRVGGGSKKLDYPGDQYGLSQGPLLGKRVSFNITDEDAKPTFEYGYNHGNFGVGDSFIRGGLANPDRLFTDTKRIGKFFLSPNGIQFLAKQVILQSQNPRPQKFYNLGINTLASVATAGVSNVTRGGLMGGTLGNLIGGAFKEHNYLTEIEEDYGVGIFPKVSMLRENNYGLGDPGKPSTKEGLAKLIDFNNPFAKKEGYNVSLGDSVSKIDKVNFFPIFQNNPSKPDDIYSKVKDFVPFRFEIIDQDNESQNDVIVFRAFLDSISDDYSATHNSIKYNGRGEEFYTYQKFGRKIAVSFKVAAQSRHEMKPIYQKINYLVAQTAPNYSSQGRIRTPYMYLTVGDWFQRIPGVLTQVGLTWQKDYPWEIALDRIQGDNGVEGPDAEMLILPHILDVNLTFQPIHNFTPSSNITTPFIGINGNGATADWISDLSSNPEDMAAETLATPENDPNFFENFPPL